MKKIGLVLMFIGEMGAASVQDLMVEIRRGRVTQNYLEKRNFSLKELNAEINGETPLLYAIREQMPDAVFALIQAGVSINKPVQGQIPLEVAILSSTVPIVRMLIEAGAEITGKTCRLASHRQEMTLFFIETMSSIQLGSQSDGKNSLHYTRPTVDQCLNHMLLDVQSLSEAQEIIELGGHADFKDEAGKTAADYAAQRCRAKKTSFLLSQGAPAVQPSIKKKVDTACINTTKRLPDPCCSTASVLVAQKPNTGVYESLLQGVEEGTLTEPFLKKYFAGFDRFNINRTFVKRDGLDALSLATQRCDARIVTLLLKYDASNIRNAFIIALGHCPKNIIKPLIAYGAKLKQVQKPLDIVIQANPYVRDIICWLARMVPKVDRRRAFLTACLKGNVPVAQKLLQCGARMNFEDEYGRTPLWNALLSQNKKMVHFVLDNGGYLELKEGQLKFVKKFFPDGFELLSSRL